MLGLIAAQLKVVQVARLKKSCRRCERMAHPPHSQQKHGPEAARA